MAPNHLSARHPVATLSWVQPHPIKVFIVGNHDSGDALAKPETRACIRQPYPALTYLENDVVEVISRRHSLRICGSPYTPQYSTYAPVGDTTRIGVALDTWAILTAG